LAVENVVGVVDYAVWISRTGIRQSDWAVLAFVVFAHLVHAPPREVAGDGQDKNVELLQVDRDHCGGGEVLIL